MKTKEYSNLKKSDDQMIQEIFKQLELWIKESNSKLDPYFYTHYKKCDTLGRVWEIVLLKHMLGIGLKVEKNNNFEFEFYFKNKKIVVEATTPEIKFSGANDNEKINCARKCILESIENKVVDFKKHDLDDPGIIAISCLKSLVVPLPEKFKDPVLLLIEVGKIFIKNPEISAILISWEWPYHFSEIWSKYNANKIDGKNDFLLIKNNDAKRKIPDGLRLGCSKVLELDEKYCIFE